MNHLRPNASNFRTGHARGAIVLVAPINWLSGPTRGHKVEGTTSLLSLGATGLESARVQIAADYYAASPDKRSMVPQPLIEVLEPYWRRLYANRPHRMGGIHDAIQSDPRVGPTSDVLLFQIVTTTRCTGRGATPEPITCSSALTG
jgi:hypothetical protein